MISDTTNITSASGTKLVCGGEGRGGGEGGGGRGGGREEEELEGRIKP